MKKWIITRALPLAAAVMGMGVSSANATFVYDLRFANGDSKTQQAVAGQTYTINVYGDVSGGTNGSSADDGLTSGFMSFLSTQTSGGGITAGGITGSTLGGGWTGAGSNVGTSGVDVNGDGIFDIGTPTTDSTGTNQVPPRLEWRTMLAGPSFSTSPGVSATVSADQNSVEFFLGSFTVTAQTVGTGSTTFSPVVPVGLAIGTSAVSGILDGTTFTVAKNTTTATPAVSGVTLVGAVPEPASLGLLMMAGVFGLGRRRKA